MLSISPRASFNWCFAKVHPSWHIYACIVGIIVGFASCFLFNRFWFESWLWFIVAAFLTIYSLYFHYRLTIPIIFIAGIIFANLRIAPDFLSRSQFQQLVGQEIVLSGTISEDPDFSEGKTVLHLSDIQLDKNSQTFSGTLYVQLANSKQSLERSDRISLQGTPSAGFGTFIGIIYRPKLLSISRAEHGDIFARLKQYFAHSVREYIASPEVDLGLGYLMGMKNGLSKEFSETLRLVGMTHVVVASGAHLGIIVNLTKKLFGRISRFAAVFSSLLMIAAFLLIVGFTPSMTRATLVTSLSVVMAYIGRRFTPLRLLTLVAAMTLLYRPIFLLNLGWQLSFASFFGLLVLLPRLQKQLYGGKNPPWLANMLLTSLATSLLCAPILIYSYGIVSLLSFVANLFILPTLPYAMLLIFLTGVISFLPFIARLIAQIASWLLDFHIFIVNYLSQKTMFILNFSTGNPWIFCFYLVIIAYLIAPSCFHFIKSYRHKFKIE